MTMTEARGAARSELDLMDPDAAEIAVDALVVEDAVDAVVVDLDAVDLVPDTVPDRAPDEGPAPQRQRHLRVAPDSVARRRHVRIAAAAAAICISATLFAVVGFNVELAQHQIQLQTLQRKLQAEQTRYYELRDEVAQRSSPSEIVSEATRRGLVQTSMTYIPGTIKLPPKDQAGTDNGLGKSRIKSGGSLDPVP